MNILILLFTMLIGSPVEKLEVSSPAFINQGHIPATFTCEGKNINPALIVKNIPADAKSLVVIMDDPDAPGKTFTHWVVWNIKPVEMIPENHIGGIPGRNSTGDNGYTGPCPPTGRHRYFFKVYAIDKMLVLVDTGDKMAVQDEIKSHILASGELMGYYKKQGNP